MDLNLRGGGSDGDRDADQGAGRDEDGSGGGVLGRVRGRTDDTADTDRSRGGNRGGGRRADDGGALAALRNRVDPRDAKEAAESATRGAVLIGVRLAGAVLVAYGLYVILLVNGWNQLGAGLAAVGVVPAYAPGFVVGLGELFWKLFRLA
jgi:hypothetical protein